MSIELHLTLPQYPDARLRMMWDALALQLDVVWVIKQHPKPYVRIHNGHRGFVVPVVDTNCVQLQTLQYASRQYMLLASSSLSLRQEGSSIVLNADVISPLQRMTALLLEDKLHSRAADGTIAGSSYEAFSISPPMLGIDYIGELASLIAQAIRLPLLQTWRSLKPKAPYAVITTFDCDGFLPGQPDLLCRFLEEHEVEKPTVFVMAPREADFSLYDPRYDPADPALRSLYEISEIGLHSSYLGYYDGARMSAQKTHLEEVVGREVHGHRSHYLRFGFPYTWGYAAQAGFTYDMTMGFYDLPGFRQGGSQPVPLADPSGWGRLLWSWGVGLMDQHLFMPDSPLAWNDGAGKAALSELLTRFRHTGGTLVLDWHVHCINSDQYPHHYLALDWLLRQARRDGAWIGGAGLLLEQYRGSASAKHMADQVTLRIIESSRLPPDDANAHAQHYVQGASNATLTSVDYIDAGAHSFLATLPPDATRIVDVGCGSGWINHRAPPLRQVLGIDIDEHITKRLSRRAIVGCLPHLPVEQKQADLVLCTDLLEHLSLQEVGAAGLEFDRISTRYAYLQTPHSERLDDSELQCSACGARWHVTHHLTSNDAGSLARVMPANWYPHSVIYTGEMRTVDSSLRNVDGELLGDHPMQGSFTCEVCGTANSHRPGTSDPQLAQAHTKERIPLPHYSEVAVMAARVDVSRSWNDAQPILVSRNGDRASLPNPYRSNSHCIDFRVPFEVASVANTYLFPCVVIQHAVLRRTSLGAELITSGLANAATVYMIFPDQHPAGESITVHGQVLSQEPAMLTLQAFNWALESCGSVQAASQGEFRLKLSIERPAFCIALYVNKADDICLYSASFSGDSRPLYLYDVGQRFAHGHVEMSRRGTSWRWLVPPHGQIWTDRPFYDQVQENFPAVAEPTSSAMNALLHFSLLNAPRTAAGTPAESLSAPFRSPLITRVILRYNRRLSAVVKRTVPQRYYHRLRPLYHKLRPIYHRLLRRLTRPNR